MTTDSDPVETEILNFPAYLSKVDPVLEFSFSELSLVVEKFSSSAEIENLMNQLFETVIQKQAEIEMDPDRLQSAIELLGGEIEVLAFSKMTRSNVIVI